MQAKRTLETAAMVLILAAALIIAYLILTYEPAPPPPSGEQAPGGGIALVTWNLYNFGRSKDAQEIAFIARVLRDYDLVAVQEVSTGPAGAQAVARLVDELDRTGTDWDYALSDPTTGAGSERYAYLWKPSRLRLIGRPWLEEALADPVDREPFLARFEANGRRMLAASFHAVPSSKDPEREVMLLDTLHHLYEEDHLLVMGDFNLSQRAGAFDGLKTLGYVPVLVDQRTSLKMRRQGGEHLASEYDNIFYEGGPLRPGRAGALDFSVGFETLREARTISDHLPVYLEVQWN